MNQWISSVNSYYYPYMIYHVTHERLVFPELGIASDEKVVAHALPKVELGLQVMERQLGARQGLPPRLRPHAGRLLPTAMHLCLEPHGGGQDHVSEVPRASIAGARGWRHCRLSRNLRAILPPRAPIEHAREWATSHRPKY